MSGGFEPFALKEEDAMKFLASQTHIGTTAVDYRMKHYMYKRRFDGTYIVNLRKTWEKMLLAARAFAAVENPAEIIVVSARPFAQRALMKFAAHTGCSPIFGRFAPGCLTNRVQKNFKEPRLIIVSDPTVDHQAVREASYANVPVISFCNSDANLAFVDVAIPCNNKGAQSLGLMYWMLAREILMIKGKISRQTGFILDDKEIMPDLYFYRDPEAEAEEKVEEEKAAEEEAPVVDSGFQQAGDWETPAAGFTGAPAPSNWDATAAPAATEDWAATGTTTEWGAAGTEAPKESQW